MIRVTGGITPPSSGLPFSRPWKRIKDLIFSLNESYQFVRYIEVVTLAMNLDVVEPTVPVKRISRRNGI